MTSPEISRSTAPAVRARVARPLALAACALLLAAALPAAAVTYKWTDASGRIVYSDQPPTGGVKYETVGTAAPPSNPNAVKEMAAKELDLNKRRADAAKAEKKAEDDRTKENRKNEMCERARSNIRTLSAEQVALIRHNEKGEPFVVDEATRRRERAEVEAWVKANCMG